MHMSMCEFSISTSELLFVAILLKRVVIRLALGESLE